MLLMCTYCISDCKECARTVVYSVLVFATQQIDSRGNLFSELSQMKSTLAKRYIPKHSIYLFLNTHTHDGHLMRPALVCWVKCANPQELMQCKEHTRRLQYEHG